MEFESQDRTDEENDKAMAALRCAQRELVRALALNTFNFAA